MSCENGETTQTSLRETNSFLDSSPALTPSSTRPSAGFGVGGTEVALGKGLSLSGGAGDLGVASWKKELSVFS